MLINDENGLGKIDVHTVQAPKDILVLAAVYTASGRVLVDYRRQADVPGQLNLGIMNDDGTDFRCIFTGQAEEMPLGNGMRYRPFADGKRILLGSWILECTPDIDHCMESRLVPLHIPQIFREGTWLLWTDIIVAPDDVHLAWTQLHHTVGSISCVGVLQRQARCYTLGQVEVISSLQYFLRDEKDPRCLIPQPLRGGEVKQFIRGGTAISMAANGQAGTMGAVVQDLVSERLWPVEQHLSYSGAAVFSPDERLAAAMTSRFSPKTDTGIFSVLPRPLGAYSTMGLIMPVYAFSVRGARSFWSGNLGPVLFGVDRAAKDPAYRGVCLASPDKKWIYCFPLCWSPDGKKVMWMEQYRGPICGVVRRRIRAAELLTYVPQLPVPPQPFPEKIPYAVPLAEMARDGQEKTNYQGLVMGASEGFAEYFTQHGLVRTTQTIYNHFSDDGRTFWSGYERVVCSRVQKCVYEANIEMTGAETGRMDLRATFTWVDNGQRWKAARLSFKTAADGLPDSYGYASCNGVTKRILDLKP